MPGEKEATTKAQSVAIKLYLLAYNGILSIGCVHGDFFFISLDLV